MEAEGDVELSNSSKLVAARLQASRQEQVPPPAPQLECKADGAGDRKLAAATGSMQAGIRAGVR